MDIVNILNFDGLVNSMASFRALPNRLSRYDSWQMEKLSKTYRESNVSVNINSYCQTKCSPMRKAVVSNCGGLQRGGQAGNSCNTTNYTSRNCRLYSPVNGDIWNRSSRCIVCVS